MKIGDTLEEIQRRAKKQSKKKNYMGWFQSFGGIAPIENAFFNMSMGSDTSASEDVAGMGEADGGIGMTGSMGESLREEDHNNPSDNGEPDMRDQDTVTFYYNSGDVNPDEDVVGVREDRVTVNKEDVIQALCYLLRFDGNFVHLDDNELEQTIRDHFESIKDDYYDQLYSFFYQKLSGDITGYDDNFTDEFYDDDVCECECEEEEEDPYFLKGTFEGIDDEDPTVRTTKYERPSNKYLKEGFDGWDGNSDELPDEDRYQLLKKKTVYDADGFTTDYTMYFDSVAEEYVMIFGDSDLYTPENSEADVTFDDKEEAYEWFNSYEGFTDEDFDECLHPQCESNIQSATPRRTIYDEVDIEEYDDEDPDFLDLYGAHGEYEDDYSVQRKHPLKEDTVKQGSKWVNKGKEGTHGKFKTKKEADAQRKAMFANGYRESFEYDDNPVNEGAFKDIVTSAIDDPDYRKRLEDNIHALEREVDFLENQAPKEIRRGGAFDSQAEIDAAMQDVMRELNKERYKLRILDASRRQ